MSKDEVPLTDMDTDKMAKFTREDAKHRPLDEGDKSGSHGFAAPSAKDAAKRRGKQRVDQVDDMHGEAPAAGMARQHANLPKRQGEEVDGADRTDANSAAED